MSRLRRVAGPTISLFPFLAVLLCTMGSLLVLLVLFSRSARDAGDAGDAAAVQAEEDLALARDQLRWRLEQVRGIRDRTANDLSKTRMQLAGVEENARALADELAHLGRVARSLDAESPAAAATDAELAALEARLKNARESLDEKRKELASKPAAYAVVPYVGPSGTHRRPLYIECCIDGVFLQPEGIRLSPGDFEGPPGPGNPLASALRAAREHVAKTSSAPGDPAVQPYPLLLVRPSGVMAYYAAREAIQSWGSEFGYQLIDEDWTLTFPPRDPALAEVERRAIEESRERLAWFAQTRPVKPNRPPQQYRAATTRGGVVSSDGPTVLGDPSRWDWAKQQKARGFNAGDADSGAAGPFGGTGAGGGEAGGTGAGTLAASQAVAAGGGSGPGPGGGNLGAGGGSSNGSGSPPWSGTGGDGSAAGGNAQAALPGELGNGVGGDPAGSRSGAGSAFTQGRGGPANADGTATDRGGAGDGADGSATAHGDGGVGAGSGMANAGGNGSGTGSGTGSGSGSTRAAGGAGGGAAMPGMLQAGGTAGGTAGSMATTRGKNWASLATADRPVPLTRPIHVECALGEIRLLDGSARRVEKRIPLGANTADSIDLFVTAVHDRVAGWGLAGDRMYWRPELILSETADGRSRREDLERLLADSGLDTRRKGDDGIRRLPPVERTSAMVSPP
jgi:hypothetical protein